MKNRKCQVLPAAHGSQMPAGIMDQPSAPCTKQHPAAHSPPPLQDQEHRSRRETEARSIMGRRCLRTPKVLYRRYGDPKNATSSLSSAQRWFYSCFLQNPRKPRLTSCWLLLHRDGSPGTLHTTLGPAGPADSAPAGDFTGMSLFPAGKGPTTPLFTRGCYQHTEESSLAPSSLK